RHHGSPGCRSAPLPSQKSAPLATAGSRATLRLPGSADTPYGRPAGGALPRCPCAHRAVRSAALSGGPLRALPGRPFSGILMARDQLDMTPIETRDELVAWLAAGAKPKAEFRIGTEHEKLPFTLADHAPVPYEGKRGIRALLEGMRMLLGW